MGYESRECFKLCYLQADRGLGIKIIGGLGYHGEKDYGIFVKSVLKSGLACLDGRLQEGDQILEVNGYKLQGVQNDEAVQVLKNATERENITLLVSRDNKAREGFADLLDYESSGGDSSSSDAEQRSSTPCIPIIDSRRIANSRLLRHPPTMSSTPHANDQSLKVSQSNAKPSIIYEPSPVSQHLESTIQVGKLSKDGGPKLDPNTRLKLEKLEIALKYLGLDLTSEQKALLRSRLKVGDDGAVTYGQFVDEVRNIMQKRLADVDAPVLENLSRDLSNGGAAGELGSISIHRLSDSPRLESELDMVMRMEKEQQRLRRENEKLREKVLQHETLMQTVREKESAAHLAEQAQKAARETEKDYELVLRSLELENARLREERNAPLSASARKRLLILESEYRKSQTARKTYEVATSKLIDFAELVHETLTQSQSSRPSSARSGAPARGKDPPSYLRDVTRSSNLADEARRVVRAVQVLLQSEPLPFGWSEAYTEDGARYYVNHVTHQTTWQHPISTMDLIPSANTDRHAPSADDVTDSKTKVTEQLI